MKNELEKFVTENRASFDVREPSERSWKVIQQNLFGQASWWNSVTVWRAAAVLFFALSAFLGITRYQSHQQQQVALREFKDVEDFYVRQISEKVNLIHEYRGAENGLNGFTHDFQQLEAMYQVLREEMRVRPSQKVKDALVLNLLVRIDLLNRQLQHIEEGEEPRSSAQQES